MISNQEINETNQYMMLPIAKVSFVPEDSLSSTRNGAYADTKLIRYRF